MLPELLLTFSCFNNTGCTETFNQYKVYNPVLVQNVEDNLNEQLKRTPESVKVYILPFAALLGGGTATVSLSRSAVLTVNKNGAAVTLTWQLN